MMLCLGAAHVVDSIRSYILAHTYKASPAISLTAPDIPSPSPPSLSPSLPPLHCLHLPYSPRLIPHYLPPPTSVQVLRVASGQPTEHCRQLAAWCAALLCQLYVGPVPCQVELTQALVASSSAAAAQQQQRPSLVGGRGGRHSRHGGSGGGGAYGPMYASLHKRANLPLQQQLQASVAASVTTLQSSASGGLRQSLAISSTGAALRQSLALSSCTTATTTATAAGGDNNVGGAELVPGSTAHSLAAGAEETGAAVHVTACCAADPSAVSVAMKEAGDDSGGGADSAVRRALGGEAADVPASNAGSGTPGGGAEATLPADGSGTPLPCGPLGSAFLMPIEETTLADAVGSCSPHLPTADSGPSTPSGFPLSSIMGGDEGESSTPSSSVAAAAAAGGGEVAEAAQSEAERQAASDGAMRELEGLLRGCSPSFIDGAGTGSAAGNEDDGSGSALAALA